MFKSIPIVFNSRRSPVISRHGMVATSQPLAVAAGLEILRQGGNAADAAVATSAALNVTEPTSTGIGGDCFALYFSATNHQVSALNGSGRAPRSLSLSQVHSEGYTQTLPEFHPYTITVPGACAGWCDLVERHGRLSMAEVLTPAIRLAQEGFPVAPITAYYWERGLKRQLKHALGGLELSLSGRAPKPGELFRNPGLACTLQKVAEGGKPAFYQGEIAQAIVSTVQQAGGCLSLDDLADHYSTWDQPISALYREYRVWECPPNGQGLAALLALNILEGFDLQEMPALSAQRLHLSIEAMRLAFADTGWYVTDPEWASVPLDLLLSKEYARQRQNLINMDQATLHQQPGTPTLGSDTVYLAVVDGEGNACSFINSNYMGFGTGIVPQGWGFSLQNRGHAFSLDPKHPNVLQPGKRPYHTIIPSLITRVGNSTQKCGEKQVEDLFACFGVMGGFMQPQGHVQVAVSLIDDHQDPQAALDRPRFCIEDGDAGGKVLLEKGISPKVVKNLEKIGQPVEMVDGYDRSVFGRGQVIVSDADNGVLWGGSDPRADGCAMGY